LRGLGGEKKTSEGKRSFWRRNAQERDSVEKEFQNRKKVLTPETPVVGVTGGEHRIPREGYKAREGMPGKGIKGGVGKRTGGKPPWRGPCWRGIGKKKKRVETRDLKQRVYPEFGGGKSRPKLRPTYRT